MNNENFIRLKNEKNSIMKKTISFILSILFAGSVSAQRSNVNQDESKVPVYTLPELLVCQNGDQVTSVAQWEKQRRPELLALFANQMYGEEYTFASPEIRTKYETLAENANALNGKAICKEVKITFTRRDLIRETTLLIYLPKAAKGKVPVFLGYSLMEIPPAEAVNANTQANPSVVELILQEGFGVVTLSTGFYPDGKDKQEESVLPLADDYKSRKTDPHAIQALGTWAWGLSRVVDYLETDQQIDAKRIVLIGHSRAGKAALWAGAKDERFAIVISTDSGCGGAALSKRCFGENIDVITTSFPYWFCTAFRQYANHESALPFDQHELIALIAPRPVYIASAEDDLWADPKGEFLAGVYAGPAYELYGLKGLETQETPKINAPIMNQIGYHIRPGKHNLTDYDWTCYLRFSRKHFKMND
jgi:hypothetical protein